MTTATVMMPRFLENIDRSPGCSIRSNQLVLAARAAQTIVASDLVKATGYRLEARLRRAFLKQTSAARTVVGSVANEAAAISGGVHCDLARGGPSPSSGAAMSRCCPFATVWDFRNQGGSMDDAREFFW